MPILRTIWFIFLLSGTIITNAQGLFNKNAFILQKAGSIVTQSHFHNNGKFSQIAGSFVFAGLGNVQKLKGDSSVSFNRLNIANGSNALLESGGHSIKSTIQSNGLLQANNHITLLSNANTTAAVDGAGTGEITGILTFQSYLNNGYGYKYLGSPFQSATVNQLADFVNLSASFPSVFAYDENLLSNGWVNYMSAANLLEPMRGYAFQFGNSNLPKTISMNGVVNNGAISLNINHHNRLYTNGFHLVSNPYPSPINWNESIGWVKVNLDNALYFFDTDEQSIYTGVYNTYINGISSNGLTNNYIPAMQAFFVRVSDGDYPVAGSLTVNNKARITHITEAHRKINSVDILDYLRLSVRMMDAKHADPLIIYFSNDANIHFSKQMDAIKLMNSSETVPSVYSFKQNHKLTIQSQLPVNLSTLIPVGIIVKTDGEYLFENTSTTSLPAGLYAYLYDDEKKKYTDLIRNSGYKVPLKAGEYNHRFSILFSKTPVTHSLNPDNDNDTYDFQVQVKQHQLYLKIPFLDNTIQSVQLTNVLGQQIFQKKYSTGGSFLIDLPLVSGIYFVTLRDGKRFVSKKILIAH